MASNIEIHYAQTDDDVIAIHRFLCVIAAPLLPGPINGPKSATEVWRVVNQDVALMAISGGMLVGTLGLVCPTEWWGDDKFLANRWMFCIPGIGAAKPLLKEAKAIGKASDMEVRIYSEERGKILILNKSKKRQRVHHHVLRKPHAEHRTEEQREPDVAVRHE